MTSMDTSYRKVRVFVASPKDVETEREALAGVVNELNTVIEALIPNAAIVVELMRWETHATPGLGRTQELINEQLSDYDVFIGIMWKRFGSPTGAAEAGTEEEFRIALQRWEESGQPRVMFYFSAQPLPPPSTPDDVEQLMKVVTFRAELSQRGLIWEYPDADKFADVVRPHLASAIGQIIRAPHSVKAQEVPVPARRPGLQIEITEIGPEDAFHSLQHLLVGQLVTPQTLSTGNDGWSAGLLEFEQPPLPHGSTRLSLFRFRWQVNLDDL